MRTYRPADDVQGAATPPASSPASVPDFAGITFDESRRLLRIMWGAARVSRHYDFLVWLNGEVQRFVPHQLLIAASGRFTEGEIRCDLTSTLPGLRTASLASCRDDDFVTSCYARWIAARRRPLTLTGSDAAALARWTCGCPVHLVLRRAQALVIHGMRDEHAGEEHLYIALRLSASIERYREQLDCMAEALFVQIDAAFRRVAAYHRKEADPRVAPGAPPRMSKREREILNWLCQGKRTADIARLLAISPFTVRNHVQHIFRKMGVANRAEAAAKYSVSVHDGLRRGPGT